MRPGHRLTGATIRFPDLGTAIAHLQAVNLQVICVRQLQSQARVDSMAKAVALGCQPSWKDPFTHGMVPSALSHGGPFTPAPVTLNLCLYRARPRRPPAR